MSRRQGVARGCVKMFTWRVKQVFLISHGWLAAEDFFYLLLTLGPMCSSPPPLHPICSHPRLRSAHAIPLKGFQEQLPLSSIQALHKQSHVFGQCASVTAPGPRAFLCPHRLGNNRVRALKWWNMVRCSWETLLPPFPPLPRTPYWVKDVGSCAVMTLPYLPCGGSCLLMAAGMSYRHTILYVNV